MESFDAVLISPQSRSLNHYRPPLSLMHIGGYLKFRGMRVKLIDVTTHSIVRDESFRRSRKRLLHKIKRSILSQVQTTRSNFYGISCYSPEYEEVKDLIRHIRRLKPKAVIIVGGVHPTLSPNDFLPIADAIVQGEGEVPTYNIIANGWRGIIYSSPYSIHDISKCDYSLVDMKYYTTANPYAIRGVYIRPAYVLASRGCPSQCAFCVAPKLREFTTAGRYRFPSAIAREVEHLKKTYAVDGIYFIDDMLTHDKVFIQNLCKALKPLKIMWGCSSKINTVDEEILKAMANAGCIQIDFGVERGSDEALYQIRKYQTVRRIKETFALCRRFGIRTFANMLVNIPEETSQDLEDIVDLLREIKPTLVSVNVYQAYLGVAMAGFTPEPSLIEWAEKMNKQFNCLWRAVDFHTKLSYLKVLLWSRGKKSYLKNLWNLTQEARNLLR
jgi:anaerobic magnesium-protoporphyrin IX monomethyl ester cyclase